MIAWGTNTGKFEIRPHIWSCERISLTTQVNFVRRVWCAACYSTQNEKRVATQKKSISHAHFYIHHTTTHHWPRQWSAGHSTNEPILLNYAPLVCVCTARKQRGNLSRRRERTEKCISARLCAAAGAKSLRAAYQMDLRGNYTRMIEVWKWRGAERSCVSEKRNDRLDGGVQHWEERRRKRKKPHPETKKKRRARLLFCCFSYAASALRSNGNTKPQRE